MEPIKNAIAICGGPAKTARLLGKSVQAVCFYRDGKRTLPAECCPILEEATGRKVLCEQLRPDVNWGFVRAHPNFPVAISSLGKLAPSVPPGSDGDFFACP